MHKHHWLKYLNTELSSSGMPPCPYSHDLDPGYVGQEAGAEAGDVVPRQVPAREQWRVGGVESCGVGHIDTFIYGDVQLTFKDNVLNSGARSYHAFSFLGSPYYF